MCSCQVETDWREKPLASDLQFTQLAKSWDEGIPLGNATVGALLWQRDSALRFSLDRTDLWDLRPMDISPDPTTVSRGYIVKCKRATIYQFRKIRLALRPAACSFENTRSCP